MKIRSSIQLFKQKHCTFQVRFVLIHHFKSAGILMGTNSLAPRYPDSTLTKLFPGSRRWSSVPVILSLIADSQESGYRESQMPSMSFSILVCGEFLSLHSSSECFLRAHSLQVCTRNKVTKIPEKVACNWKFFSRLPVPE